MFFDGEEPRVYATERAARFIERSTTDETSGNVHAIALPVAMALAAPELLAALEGGLGWIERYAGDASDDSPELWRHIAAARAAIAKARGGDR